MKSILKATAVLSSASVVSILMGLVSAKVSALLLGPAGLGYMGLLQSLLGLGTIIAGMGVSTGLVRAGAKALAQQDERQEAALRSGARLLCLGLGGLAVLLMILLRAPLSRFMLGGAQHAGAVVLVGAALLLTLAAAVQTGILNAHHRVGELARVGVLNSLFGVLLTLLLIWRWRERGIAWAVLAAAGVSWCVSYYYARRRVPAPRVALSAREVWTEARALLGFGAPYTASMLVGAGVQLALPVLVLHALGTNDVGFYRAAAAISVNYLGFLIAAMAQDYYPRVSAVSDQPAQLHQLINEQYRLVLLLGGPIILGMLALVPYLVPLLYSAQFAPTVALLEWQLLGDIFKFAAWTMSFVILARSGSLTFFCTELVGGSSLLLFSWLGMRWLGLEGLGLGFVGCTVIYYLLCWTILRRDISLRLTKENGLLFLTITLAALVIRALPYVGLERFRTPVALVLAALASFGSLYVIWGEVGGLKGLLARRNLA
jgi:enterobacterial common antigen flippase